MNAPFRAIDLSIERERAKALRAPIANTISDRSAAPPAAEQMRRGNSIPKPAQLARTVVGSDCLGKGSQSIPEGSEATPKATATRAHLTEKRSGSLFRSLTEGQQAVLRSAALAPVTYDGTSWRDGRGRAFRAATITGLRERRLLSLTTRGGLIVSPRGRQVVANAHLDRPLAYAMHGYAARRLSEIPR